MKLHALPMRSASRVVTEPPLPPLENGDRLDQKTYHERYEAMPDHVKAELIGGIVYIAMRQGLAHGRAWSLASGWLASYEHRTPSVETLMGATNILGPDSEPQPDNCLLIEPDTGGQARYTEDDYLEGAPELMMETAATTESIDLHGKKDDYEKAGVREYIVAALRSKKVFWFVRRQVKFRELSPDADGNYRSTVFPGLWLDPQALLEKNLRKLLRMLRRGLASAEHKAFVKKLNKRK